MTQDDARMDELLDQAKPSILIPIAALVLVLEATLLIIAGLQGWAFLRPGGVWAAFPPALLGCGVLSVIVAFALGKVVRGFGAVALLLSLLDGLVAGGWLVVCMLNWVISPGVFMAAAMAPIAVLFSAIALIPFRRCAKARRILARDLEGMAPSSGGGGLVVAAALVGLVIAGGLLVLKTTAKGDPMVVAVVVRGGIDEGADLRIADTVARELGKTGLTVVVGDETLPAEASLDEGRRAAGKLGAAHAVVLDLSARVEREGVVPGTQLHVVTCTGHFTPTGSAGEDAVFTSDALEFAFERATAGEIVSKVEETWAEALSPWVVDLLFASEAFAPVLEADVDLEQVTAAMQLASMEDAVWDRRAMAQGYDDFCSLERERLDILRGGEINGVQCLGDPCSQYTLIGVDRAGRAIVQDGSRRPLFKIPLTAVNAWTEKPERVFAVDLAQPDVEQDLLRTSNFYDFGNVDPERGFASMETFGSNRAEAIYTVDLSTGAPRDVALLEPRERTSWILAAPGGDGALAKIKRGSCVLISSEGRVELPAFRRARWVVTAEGPQVLGQTEDGAAALYDLQGQPGRARLAIRGSMARAFGAHDGELTVIEEDTDGCRLLRVDAGSLAVRQRQEMPRCFHSPQRLDDGRILAVSRVSQDGDAPGDKEVVLWDPATGELTQLTSGTHDEETVYSTPDGRHAVFNRRLEDWPAEYDTNTYRRQVCWVDIPVE